MRSGIDQQGTLRYRLPAHGYRVPASHQLAQTVKVDAALLDLRGAWAGQRCHILGNGPSLADADLRALSGDRVVGVNASPLADQRLGRAADLYCVSDRRFLRDPDKLRIAAQTSGSLRVFAGYCADYLTDGDIQYVRIVGAIGASSDLLAGVYHGGSVVCFAAQIAMWAGAREVVMHGCEFDYGNGRFYGPGQPDPRAFRVVQRAMWYIAHAMHRSGAQLSCSGRSRLLGDMGDRPVPGLRRASAR